jgi:hypothetical protein
MGGKIDRILDQLPDEAAAVLLNAVYLKVAWAPVLHRGRHRWRWAGSITATELASSHHPARVAQHGK